MRQYLLPKDGTFYKANLHSHSVLSDGRLSAEQMKEEYQKRGYSILAVSDHDFLHRHNELSEENFLMLTAYEVGIKTEDDPTPYVWKEVMDLNLIAKDPDEERHAGFHPDTISWLVEKGVLESEKAQNAKYIGELREMRYDVANVNNIIKCASENGYLVTLNHPMYSLISAQDFLNFEGMFAVEIYNHSCHTVYGMSDSETVYEEILRSGKKVSCIATDDNHNTYSLDSYLCDSFGGFTMIKSENLEYQSVISALEKGCFYASTGPEIMDLYYEDGKVHIKTSPVSEISMLTMGRKGERIAGDDHALICEAEFQVDMELCEYVRFRITDKTGKKAWTNPYYVSEFRA